LSGRFRIKDDFQKLSLINQEWYLAREMLTSKMAHTGWERETHLQNNIKAKPEQLKLSKTDPLMWP
jgi:hypothetical protein